MNSDPADETRGTAAPLQAALRAGQLLLHYQPKLDLSDGRIVGAEALLRWRHPERGVLTAAQFAAELAAVDGAAEIGDWVLRTACAQSAEWQAAGLPPVAVAVNVSGPQFVDPVLDRRVGEALVASGLDPRLLEIELTEDTVMQDAERGGAKLEALGNRGVRIVLDDFGTGYSSLTYLRRFPLDQLKIDRSFVQDLTTDADAAAIVGAVISMGHSLGLSLVAEGVETMAQLAWLRRARCEQIQGYVFSPAVEPDRFAALLAGGSRLSLPDRAGAPDAPTLLIVDDEANVVSALVRLLRSDGYRIVTAASAADALDVLAREPVQVVISDHRMPETTGAEFLGTVKSMYPATVRILFSGYIEVDALTDAVNRGAVFRFLLKPWSDDDVRDAVREAFQYYRLTSGAVADPGPPAA